MGTTMGSREWLHSKRCENGKFGEKFLPRALIYLVHFTPPIGTLGRWCYVNITAGPIVDYE